MKHHVFDRRNDVTLRDMRRGAAPKSTVYCLDCKRYITVEQLDQPCGGEGRPEDNPRNR